MVGIVRIAFIIVIGLHGLIHLMGFAKAFGFADLPQLSQPIARPLGLLWLAAAILTLVALGLFVAGPRWWSFVAFVAILLSQIVIASAWRDARWGTVANVVFLAGALYSLVARSPP